MACFLVRNNVKELEYTRTSMDDLPMSKKYKKFELNTEKLNLHSQMGHLEQQEKNALWSNVMAGGHSLDFLVHTKRLCFAYFAKPTHYMMG